MGAGRLTDGSSRFLHQMHIGHRVKEIFDAQPKGYTAARLAAEIHCERRNVYRIFEKKSLDTDQLLLLSRALGHDFFADLSEELLH